MIDMVCPRPYLSGIARVGAAARLSSISCSGQCDVVDETVLKFEVNEYAVRQANNSVPPASDTCSNVQEITNIQVRTGRECPDLADK